MRTQTDLRHIDSGAFCKDWWRGLDCSLTVTSFASLWATPPIFCTMIGVTPGDQEPDTHTMEMTISMAWPHQRSLQSPTLSQTQIKTQAQAKP